MDQVLTYQTDFVLTLKFLKVIVTDMEIYTAHLHLKNFFEEDGFNPSVRAPS